MAAMAKLAAGVVPHLTPFFHSTKCATAAASSCLTPCECSLEPSLPLELRLRMPPWLTSRGHAGHHGQAALGHRATNQTPTIDTPKLEDATMPLYCHWCEPSSLCHHRHSARAAPAHGHSHEPPLVEPRLLEDACRPPATLPPPLIARAPPLPAGATSRPPSLLPVS
jgi:hypothetical protein